MTVQSSLGVERALIGSLQLVDGIVVDLDDVTPFLFLIISNNRSRETAIGQAHEDAVEPHLVGIDGLVPVDLVGLGARLILQLLHHGLHSQQVLLFRPLLVHPCDEVPGTDIVEVVVEDVVATYFTFLIDHRVSIHLAILAYILTAIAQISIEHTLQLDTHHVAPLRFRREVEHIGLWHTLHL